MGSGGKWISGIRPPGALDLRCLRRIMKTATRATKPSGTPIDVPRIVVVGRVLEDSLVAFPTDTGAVEVWMEDAVE